MPKKIPLKNLFSVEKPLTAEEKKNLANLAKKLLREYIDPA